mgnify:CR=1 FL=1
MTDTSWHLPNPDTQPEFYADVPLKRLFAFVVDTVVIIGLSLLIVPLTAFTGIFFFPILMTVVGFAYRVVTLANGGLRPSNSAMRMARALICLRPSCTRWALPFL